MVEAHGAEAVEATNGLEGLEQAERVVPDVIISDALMPVMDGFQFLRSLKQNASLSSIPIFISSSSYQEGDDVSLAMALGAEDYLLKPIDPVALWNRIEALFSNRGGVSAPRPGVYAGDEEYLKRYSQVVVHKLEEKVAELEKTLEEKERLAQALRDDERRYRLLLDSITDYLYTVPLRDGVPGPTIHGPGCSTVTGYEPEDYAADPELWTRTILAEDRTTVERLMDRVRAGESGPPLEHRLVHRDGSIRWVRHTSIPRFDEKQRLVAIDGVIEDITDRKHSESVIQAKNEELAQSLKEKETLLRELYHRTKNTMQLIWAFLSLEARNLPESEAFSQFLEKTERRIQSVSLVHQMLYRAQNLSEVSIQDYIRDLASLILSSFELDEKITLKLDVAPLSFLIDTSIPLGLIINELMANSVRHAFPDHRKGEIHIALAPLPGNRVEFTYSDNGVGVPADFDFRSEATLGLTLVFGLGQQLGGTITMRGTPSVQFRIEFPVSLYSARV